MDRLKLIIIFFITIIVTPLYFTCTLANNSHFILSDELVTRYAPLVYLDKNEEYFPSSVEFFLKNVRYDPNRNLLTTVKKLNCPSCDDLSFLTGQNINYNQVPAYAMVVPKPNIGQNITDVIYWMFYPYNRGKRVCISPIYIGGRCLGKYSTFGHHVGDWEHVTLRFYKQMPIKIYLSQHNAGGKYNWGDKQIKLVNDQYSFTKTHPVIFSAKGSHGLYATPGNHIYHKIFNGDKLIDKTSQGAAWKTWDNVKIIHKDQLPTFSTNFPWLNFNGRWGNYKDGCTFLGFNFEKILKNCMLNSGPSSPAHRAISSSDQTIEQDELN